MIRNGLIALALLVAGSFGMALALPSSASADACSDKGRFLTFRPWYTGLTNSDCSIKKIDGKGNTLQKFVLRVVFNVVDMLIQLVAYIAAGFVIYGGFLFMTSGGSPEKALAGRKTVFNAMIGMVIAIASVALVNMIGGALLS